MAQDQAIHYAGGLVYRLRRGKAIVLRGWAACCSGAKVVRIREQGNQTYDREGVSCKTCLKRIAAEVRVG